MTKEEVKAYIEKNGNAEAVVEEIRKMTDEGVEVTEQELTRRLRAVDRSLGAMEKQFTKPDAPECEKVPTRMLRQIARSDIEWFPLLKVCGLCILPLLLFTIMPIIFPASTVIASLMGALTIIWGAVMTVCLCRRFLDISREQEPQSFFSEVSHTPSMILLILLKGLMVAAPLMPGAVIAISKPMLGGAICVAGLIAAVFIGITYSQAEFNLVEGSKAIQSLKFSRLAMKDDRARYFVMMIPLILWSALAALCASAIIAVPMTTAELTIPTTALTIVMTIAAFVFALPISIYTLMCQAEFYNELRGIKLTEREPKRELAVFAGTVAAGLVLMIIALLLV